MTCQRAGASGRQPGRRTGDGVTNFEINAARYALIAIGSPRARRPNYQRMLSRCRTNGGLGGDRTHDHRLKRALLYR